MPMIAFAYVVDSMDVPRYRPVSLVFRLSLD